MLVKLLQNLFKCWVIIVSWGGSIDELDIESLPLNLLTEMVS